MGRTLRAALSLLLSVALLSASQACLIYDEKGRIEIPSETFDRQNVRNVVIGLTTKNGEVLAFRNPARFTDASVCGQVDGRELCVDLANVQHFVVRQRALNTAKTILASVGMVVGILAALTLVVALTKQSCPFFYSWNGSEWVFDAEPLGGAISRGLERADDVRLDHLAAVGGRYRLLMTNEVQETQRTDQVALRVVDHAPGVRVVPGEDGRLHGIRGLVAATSAVTSGGKDVTRWLASPDGLALESPATLGPDGETRDEVILTFPKPEGARIAHLVVDAGTTLFGSSMIREALKLRGRDLGEWLSATESDPATLAALHEWNLREELWLLRIEVGESGGWVTRGELLGMGPLVMKERAVTLDVSGSEGRELRLRVRPPRGYWTIDSFAVSYGPEERLDETFVALEEARDAAGADHRPALIAADGVRDVMPIGGAPVGLTFPAPPPRPGMERTVFLRARGYYSLDLEGSGEPDAARLERLLSEPGYGVRLAAEIYPRWVEQLRRSAVAR